MEKNICRVVISEDHEVVRMGLKNGLNGMDNIKVTGEASKGEELLNLLKNQEFDLAIIDLGMPGMSGLTLIQKIKEEHPKMKTVVVTAYRDREYVRKARDLGANGYVLKDEPMEKIAGVISDVARGQDVFPEFIVTIKKEMVQDTPLPDVLSSREREVLELIARGKKNAEIAASLDISTRTVEFHKNNTKNKLNLFSTAELVKYSIEHNL